MTVFTRDELKDLITAIDVLTGAYEDELEQADKGASMPTALKAVIAFVPSFTRSRRC